MAADDNYSFQTCCNHFYVTFVLTDKGIDNWKEVLAVFEAFVSKVDV